MALRLDILTSGQLTTTQAELFKVETDETMSARVHLVNTATGATVKVNLWVQNGNSTARRVLPLNLELGAQESAKSDYFELGSSDSIEGKASAGSLVDYTISGIIRS